MATPLGINRSFTLGGKTFGDTRTVSDDASAVAEFLVPAAQPGVLSVRTNNNTGTLTMNVVGHGIITGQIIDLYWTDANGNQQCQHQITVGTVAGTSVPIASGAGTNLPAAAFNVIVGVRVSVAVALVGNNVSGIVVYGDSSGCFDFLTSAPAEIATWFLPSQANSALCKEWDKVNGDVNPLVGATLASVAMSHSNIVLAQTMRVGFMFL